MDKNTYLVGLQSLLFINKQYYSLQF